MFEKEAVVKRGETGTIEIEVPDAIRPNKYEAQLVFFNDECGNFEDDVVFDVLYPSDVIAQRWNDVLALKNAEYNGGYEFTAYQWYLNGELLEGFTSSQMYEAGKNLDFNGVYQVELTRKDDGVVALTCGITPVGFAEENMSDVPNSTLVFSNESNSADVVKVSASEQAKGYLYNLSGVLCSVFDLNAGENSLAVPNQAGVYVMRLVRESGNVETIKIVIK